MKKRYQISEDFKAECHSNFAKNRQGRIHVIEDDINIVGENYDGQLVSFTVEDDCYVNGKFIGTTVAKKITVNILNPNNEINLENKEISVFAGIEINGIKEEIPFGNFIVEKTNNKEVQNKTTFIGYDYMIKFNVPYKDTNTYPISVKKFLSNLCNQVGLELATEEMVNDKYEILGNPFTNNETCKTVLGAIAELCGGFAKIGRDNKVHIITLANKKSLTVETVNLMTVEEVNKMLVGEIVVQEAVEKLDGNNYGTTFKKNNIWGEVNSLILRLDNNVEGENTVREDSKSIIKNGLTEITISGNEFLKDENERKKVIPELWENLRGIKYLPFSTDYYGYPYLDSGDKIKVLDNKDVEYDSYVLNHKFTYNGSFSGKITTEALTKTETKYKNTPDIKTRFRNVELKVDKINGEITSVIEKNDKNSERISQAIQSVDSWSTKVAEIMDLTDTKSDTKKIEISDGAKSNLIELRIKGNNVVFESKYFDDDVYVSEDTYLGGDSKIRVNNVIYELGIKDVLRQKAVTTTDADGKEQIINYYDEYIYSYVDGKSQVIRRINPETNYPYMLEGKTERIEELTYFDIPFEEGINVVEIVNYSANFSISYLQKNDYTSYFVSNLQLEGELQVSKDEILGEVSETYTTKDETKQVKSQISQKASSVLIDVTNGRTTASIQVALEDENGNILDSKVGTINMTGIVTFEDLAGEGRTRIDGANIVSGKISAERLDTSTINSVNGTIGGFKITEVGLQAEGVLIASDGGTIFTNLHTVYEGTEYADLPTTKSYSVDSNATIRHINLIGDGTAMNVAGYTKNFNLYASQSDPQLKKNIKETEVNGLDVINQIEHIEFNWKSNDKFQANGYNAKQLGEICEDFVIAVEQPEGAEYSEILQVRDFNMMPYITKAIQELDKKIKELQEENRILKNMIKGVDENG